MSRNSAKGYFVKGQFVAKGSALDLEFKRALKGREERSKTDLKRESQALQSLGADLLTLRADLLARLALPEKLAEALAEAHRITDFEGRRRQLQFIGKLMRRLEPGRLNAVRDALGEQRLGSARETLALHEAEHWRDALIAGDEALPRWLAAHPEADPQPLRVLIRQARKDAQPDQPGQAPRHGRAYRDIFRLVRERLAQTAPAAPSQASAEELSHEHPH